MIRWPTIYDFDQLKNQIKRIVDSNYIRDFYTLSINEKELYQGDVLYLDKKFAFLNAEGNFEAVKFTRYWVILGNSCDFSREVKDLPYTNIAPLQSIEKEIPEYIVTGLKNFQNYKRMYFPNVGDDNLEYFLDFTQTMTISKQFLENFGIDKLKKRELTHQGWVLLHSCLIRYFTRDDGRFDK